MVGSYKNIASLALLDRFFKVFDTVKNIFNKSTAISRYIKNRAYQTYQGIT